MIRTTTRAAALLAVGTLALSGCSGGESVPPTPTTSAARSASDGGGQTYATDSPAATSSSDTPSSSCTADDSDQKVPAEAPETDAWPAYHGTGIPVSARYGPIDRDGEVWTCFSHSPTGALFAGAYIRAASGTPEVREQYFSDDPALDEGASEADGIQLVGYKFTSYDSTIVSIELVYEGSQNGESGLVAFPVTLYWENGQWVVHAADMETDTPHSVTGLTGYVPWSVGA